MIVIAGLIGLAIFIGIVVLIVIPKHDKHKKTVKTVRCAPDVQTIESDSRYSSITKTVGDDELESVNKEK